MFEVDSSYWFIDLFILFPISIYLSYVLYRFIYPIDLFIYPIYPYTLSGRTGSALVWHTRGRAFESRLLQQVLRFVGRVNTVQYVELKGYCPWGWGGGCDQSIGSTVSDAIVIVRSWLWSTATRSSPVSYFSNYCK